MKKQVAIRYKLKKGNKVYEIAIPNESYYDPIESGESYQEVGIARFQDPHQYLNVDPKELEWIVLVEPLEVGSKVFRYQYFDGIDSHMVHTKCPNEDEEIIHSFKLDDDRTIITRTLKRCGESWTTTSSLVMDRQENIKSLTSSIEFNELLEFGRVNS